MISECNLANENYDNCSSYCRGSSSSLCRSSCSGIGRNKATTTTTLLRNVKRASRNLTTTTAAKTTRSASVPHLSLALSSPAVLALMAALLLVATAPLIAVRATTDQQLYKLTASDEGQLLAAAEAAAAAGQQAADHNAPGHYEFEMAPKMEPPSVRKPPYIQSALMCPGSDPFAGFSPTDTLCGDLNQGRVPINPLGQAVTDQAYPFELIKNKTLQFLARALPVLKLEYETIPKVARYLSANHLLNPTHQASPLSSEHMQQLNQRFAMSNGLTQEELLANTAYLQLQQHRRRRKKRSVGTATAANGVVSGEHSIGITVAEMSPNATLVFSSAHSSAGGRIGSSPSSSSATHYLQHHHYSPAATAVSKNESSEQALTAISTAAGLALLTKDGHKTIASATSAAAKPQRLQQQQQQAVSSTKHGQNHYAWAQSQLGLQTQQQQKTGAQSSSASGSDNSANKKSDGQQQQASGSTTVLVANAATSARNDGDSKQSGASGAGKQRQQAAGAPANLLNSAPTAGQQHNHVTPSEDAGIGESRDEQQQPGNIDSAAAAGAAFGQGRSSGESSSAPRSSPSTSTGPSGATNSATSSGSNGNGSQQPSSSATPSRRRAFPCSESGSGFTAAICQAASALIEGDRPPAWLQIVKHLGNAYSGASADNMVSSSSGSPIWSILSNLAQEPSISRGSSGGIGSSLSSSSAQSKTANLLGLLGPLTSFLSGTSAKDSSSGQDYSSPQNKEHPSSSPQTLASALSTIGSSTMTRLALAGWASNAIASLVEYFVPSAFQSASRTFAKRKKPFDPQETFVDTPASLVAAISSKSSSSPANGFASAKQPPTPCPSVEEYISPTFARNYQGAWKYVVQIPHEGYFTQTIQRTSCVRQKCEFTEGVCHESPRWVSLLVAEIYYPNTIFGGGHNGAGGASNQLLPEQQQQLQQQIATSSARNQMATSSSTNNIQQIALQQAQQQQRQLSANGKSLSSQVAVQDPLQMTDSFNTYNHNLNAAFINAANELGLDPNNVANMQQLANAYNYQLMQRNGLLSGQQQQPQPQQQLPLQSQPQLAESRSSQQQSYVSQGLQAPANQPIAPNDQYAQIEAALLAANTNQQQQLQLQQQGTLSQSEYITALAAAALQQNPNLNINDLINSLQRRRKKRDISAVGGGQYSQQYNGGVVSRRPIHHQKQQQQFDTNNNNQPIIQQRSSISSNNPETMPPMNDINTHLPQQLLTASATNNVGSLSSQSQQQLYKQPVSSQSQSDSQVSIPGAGNGPMSQHQQGPQQQQQQIGPNNGDMNQQQQPGAEGANQVECDGHDKIGCYVVRVYYDWFLVNGSCKCWKTTNGSQQAGGNSASGNSFLRRIFTG